MKRSKAIIGCLAVLVASRMAWAQGGFSGPGAYEITNIQSGRVLDMDRNDQHSVIQFESRGTDNQRWDIIPARDGGYFVRNRMNGNALDETSGRNSSQVQATPFNGSPGQVWRIENGKDGNALIVSNSGKALDIPDGSNRNGIKVQLYDRNGDSNQRFTLRRVGSSGSRFNDGYNNDRRYDDRYERPGDRYNSSDRRGDDRGYNTSPDRTGRYWDERDRMWKVQGDGVCFYTERDYRGDAYCSRRGDDIPSLSGDWQSRISSVRLFGRAREVEVWSDNDYRGRSTRIRRDEPDLRLDNRVSSFRIR